MQNFDKLALAVLAVTSGSLLPNLGQAASPPAVIVAQLPAPEIARANGSPVLASTASGYVPVCSNGEYLGDNGLSPSGQEWQTRRIFYCPHGATTIQLMFAGAYAGGPTNSTPTEHTLVDPQVMDLSVETYVPPVWRHDAYYNAGDQVSSAVATDNGRGSYVAVVASQGILPTAANSGKWRVTTTAPIPITCNGTRPCVLGTTTSDGKTTTNPFLVTDPLTVNIAPGSLIAIRSWVHQTGSQVLAVGASQTPMAGSYTANGTSEPDLTLSGNRIPVGAAHNIGPFAVVGVPQSPTPSVCILGDSRAAGASGLGMSYVTLYDGGSGYTYRDIGRLVGNIDTGGSSDNPIFPASYAIQNVSGGKVTQIAVYDPGHYAVTKTGAAGVATTPPIGPQPTHPLHATNGSGVMVNVLSTSMSATAGFYEDPTTFAQGFVQKGLSDAGVPFASFSRVGDRGMTWVAPGGDTNRLAAIARTGCTSAVIEFGINDIHAGQTAAQVETTLVTLARQLLALGTVTNVYLTTLQPQTNSTDHWVSVKHQSLISAYESARQAVNTWERTGPSPFSAIFDTTAPVEVNALNVPTLNGGYWITNGRPHYATPDSVHLSPAATELAAAVITGGAAMLK